MKVKTKSKTIRAAYIAGIFAILAAIVYNWPYLLLLFKKPKLELIEVVPHSYFPNGNIAISIVDLKLKNTGNEPSYIKRIIVEVIEKQQLNIKQQKDEKQLINELVCKPCHIVEVSKTYYVSLAEISKEKNKELSVFHSVSERNPERVALVFYGSESFVAKAKITLIANSKKLSSDTFNILVLGNISTEKSNGEEIEDISALIIENSPILEPIFIKNKLESLNILVPEWIQ